MGLVVVLKLEEIKNTKYGMLTITEEVERYYTCSGKPKRQFLCKCDCGKEVTVVIGNLRSGNTRSCGCDQARQRKLKYGLCGGSVHHKREYCSWKHMLGRCYDPKEAGYESYGGVGVKVCDRWNPSKGGSFSNFYEDMGDRPEGCTLHRVNSVKLYSKDTCIWADLSHQAFDTKQSKRNTSGRTGVQWDKEKNKWYATICVKRNVKFLGYYEDFEGAVAAREAAELEHFGFLKQG